MVVYERSGAYASCTTPASNGLHPSVGITKRSDSEILFEERPRPGAFSFYGGGFIGRRFNVLKRITKNRIGFLRGLFAA